MGDYFDYPQLISFTVTSICKLNLEAEGIFTGFLGRGLDVQPVAILCPLLFARTQNSNCSDFAHLQGRAFCQALNERFVTRPRQSDGI